MTAKQLAEILDVSSKTIYRKIKNINETTGRKDIIISEKGRGFKLDYKAYIQAKLETTGDILAIHRQKDVKKSCCKYCLNHQST